MADFLARHESALAADVKVIADSPNWEVDVPAFTTWLRGLSRYRAAYAPHTAASSTRACSRRCGCSPTR